MIKEIDHYCNTRTMNHKVFLRRNMFFREIESLIFIIYSMHYLSTNFRISIRTHILNVNNYLFLKIKICYKSDEF
jgi:hypothetical protein